MSSTSTANWYMLKSPHYKRRTFRSNWFWFSSYFLVSIFLVSDDSQATHKPTHMMHRRMWSKHSSILFWTRRCRRLTRGPSQIRNSCRRKGKCYRFHPCDLLEQQGSSSFQGISLGEEDRKGLGCQHRLMPDHRVLAVDFQMVSFLIDCWALLRYTEMNVDRWSNVILPLRR